VVALVDKSGHPKKAALLAAYAECGVVSRACTAAEVGRATHYLWLKEDPEYAAAFCDAHQYAIESMEAEARRRAIEGWDEPVFHEGSVCGHKRKFSDTLLIFMLKGAAPEKYRERTESTVVGSIGVEHSGAIAQRITIEQLLETPDYVEWLRERERDSDPRLIRANGHEGNGKPVDDGHTRNGH
jgi:hypothetical protein